VGFGDFVEGEKGDYLKIELGDFSKPFHPTQLLRFPSFKEL